MRNQAQQPLTLAAVTCTNQVRPSSWEAVAEDGRMVFIRYRFGRLAVGVARHMMVAYEGTMRRTGMEPWFERQVGDEFDGFMELEDACRTAGILIAPGTLKGGTSLSSAAGPPR